MNMQAHHSSGMAHADNPAKQKEHMAVLDLVKHGDATHVAVKNGNWSDASTWRGGKVPGNGAKVLIGDNLNVKYDAQSDARLKTIRVDGQLDFATQQNTKMVIDTFVVSPSGTLTVGTKQNPVAGNVDAEIWIADNGKIDRRWDPTQISRGLISHGEVEIYGQEKASHVKVSKNAMAGDQELVLGEAPKNWQVGDSLVLTGTKHVPSKWNPQKREMEWQGTQDEELTIKAINGNRVTLDRPLTYDHDTPRSDLKAYVTNFSRNVSITSENADRLPSNQRGHVMFMHSDDVDVRYAEFRELGRSDKSIRFDDFRTTSNGTRILDGKGNTQAGPSNNIRGRYAVHFHRSGDDISGEPARAVGNAVWGSPGWGFVNHDSHVVMEKNAAYDVFGSAFVTETGNETGAMRNNIAIKSEGAVEIAKEGTRNHDIARNGVGFWFQGRLVENENNVAAGQRHAGSVYLLRGEDQMDVATSNLDFPETARYQDKLLNGRPHIESFKNNEVFATNKGLEVIKANPNQGHDARSVIDGLKAWEVRTGTHLEYTSKYTLKNLDFVGAEKDGKVGISFGNNAEDMVVNGAKVKGFGVGIATTKKHTFGKLDDWSYAFVDADIDGKKINIDGKDRFLSGNDLNKGRLKLDVNSNTDFHFNGREDVNINGTKTDSIGSRRYWSGTDSYEIKASGIRNRIKQGYYTDKNGTPFFTVEERIADRATGETTKLEYVFTIDQSQKGLLDGARKLGTYGGTVQRGLAQGGLKSFIDSTSGGSQGGKTNSDGDMDHSDMDHGGMDHGDMGDAPSPDAGPAPSGDIDQGDMGDDMGDMGDDMGDDTGDMGDMGDVDSEPGDTPAPGPDAGPVTDNSVEDDANGSGDDGAGAAPPSSPTGESIRIEAEDMDLDGYRVENNGRLSGEQLISFVNGGSAETGSASTTFDGPAGTYDVVVSYIDENDGQAGLEAKLNGQSLDAWQLDQNLGDGYITDRTQTQRTVGDRVSLAPGDRIEIVGQEQANEHARVDYLELIPVEADSANDPPNTAGEDGGTDGEATDGEATDGEATDDVTDVSTDTPISDPAAPTPDVEDNADDGPSNETPEPSSEPDPALDDAVNGASESSDAPSPSPDTAPSDPMRIEAEDMTLDGYRIENNGTFSGQKAISFVGQQSGESGSASTTFDGPTGTYDVVVSYTDETDGNARLEAKLNGSSLEAWQFDQDLGDSFISSRNQVQRTVAEGVTLEAGDRIEIAGQEQGNEHARVDYVELIPVQGSAASDSGADAGALAGSQGSGSQAPAAAQVLKSPVQLQGSTWKAIPIDYQVTPNTVMQLEFRSGAEGAIHAIGLDTDAFVDASDRSELVQLSGTENWGIEGFDYVTSSGWQAYDIPVGQFTSEGAAYLSLLTVNGEDGGDAMSEFRNVRLSESLGSDTLPAANVMADPLAASSTDDPSLMAMAADSTF